MTTASALYKQLCEEAQMKNEQARRALDGLSKAVRQSHAPHGPNVTCEVCSYLTLAERVLDA